MFDGLPFPLRQNQRFSLGELPNLTEGVTWNSPEFQGDTTYDSSNIQSLTPYKDTKHLYNSQFSWLITTTDPTSEAGEHFCFISNCSPDVDMQEVRDTMQGTEPFFVTRFEFDDENKKVLTYIDASKWWDQTDWQPITMECQPYEASFGYKALTSGVDIHLLTPVKQNEIKDFQVKARAVKAGESITIEKQGDYFLVIILRGSLDSFGHTMKQRQFIELRTPEISFTANEDTLLAIAYL